MIVGYKLIRDADGAEVQKWGGIYGQTAAIPNPIILANGDQVCGVKVGDRFAGHTVVEWDMEAPPPTAADVNIERDKRISGGFYFNDMFFQCRPDDRENIAGASTLAALALMAGAQPGDYRWHGGAEDFSWIAYDNSLVKMDAQTMIAFGKKTAEWKSAHIFAARAMKDNGIPADYTDPKYWPS